MAEGGECLWKLLSWFFFFLSLKRRSLGRCSRLRTALKFLKNNQKNPSLILQPATNVKMGTESPVPLIKDAEDDVI